MVHNSVGDQKRRASIAVVPKSQPEAVKSQHATSSAMTTAVPTQPTPELPQSASVTAAKRSTDTKPSTAIVDAKENAENNKPDTNTDGGQQRTANMNPLTAIINDQAMVLTRQYRNRVRMKLVGDRFVKRITKENIPRTATSTGNDVKAAKTNASGHSDAPSKASTISPTTALVRKVKKKIRKMASSANGKLHRAYKIETKGGEKLFPCRHCGRKYRWKSTLRRHENDECGNKEPAHQCPYCPYKAKQRGNLGVHVRKHHADKPKLESCRKRKTL